MQALKTKFEGSPLLARVVPFAVFLGLTSLQSLVGPAVASWLYFLKTLIGGWLVWMTWGMVSEMRWDFSLRALGIGIFVCVFWVGLDSFYPHIGGKSEGWNPFVIFKDSAALGWFFVVVRILGSTIVVPPLEEVFYRSFMYRYLVDSNFSTISLAGIRAMPFWLSSIVFGFAHSQWLAGILCGALYQWLVSRSGRLGEAMVAHAVTNCLLGIYIVYKGAWQFW